MTSSLLEGENLVIHIQRKQNPLYLYYGVLVSYCCYRKLAQTQDYKFVLYNAEQFWRSEV